MFRYQPADELYEYINELGEGTCGAVLKARDKKNGEIVAMKRIKQSRIEEGFPMFAMREIKYLRMFNHPNIVKLKNIVTSKSHQNGVFLVFEYCEYDLQSMLNIQSLSLLQVKSYFRQLLLALQQCFNNNIMHRDLKPANVLVTQSNVVKLADFGLAKAKNPGDPQTPKVITTWYRPPELLLGSTEYSFEVDIWSAGCILYEMITRYILFQTSYDFELHQFQSIVQICGIPKDNDWPEWKKLPNAELFKTSLVNNNSSLDAHLKKSIPPEFNEAIELIKAMLQYNPKNRVSINEALNYSFIANKKEEFEPEKLPLISLAEVHQNRYNNKSTKARSSDRRPKRQTPKSVI